jgi:hypothetical protein
MSFALLVQAAGANSFQHQRFESVYFIANAWQFSVAFDSAQSRMITLSDR